MKKFTPLPVIVLAIGLSACSSSSPNPALAPATGGSATSHAASGNTKPAKLSPSGFNVIYSFANGSDGAHPYAGATMSVAGSLYGTTYAGGRGLGTIYQLKHQGSGWMVVPQYSFRGAPNDGADPRSKVVVGPDGNLYGTTFQGGTGCTGINPPGCGTVFELKPAKVGCITCTPTETVLYRFTGLADGSNPTGDIVFDSAGNIYGTAQIGGNIPHCGGEGCGVVYKLTHAGSGWTESVVYVFQPTGGDGFFPNGVVFKSGALIGTTVSGGAHGYGAVFKVTTSGSESILYSLSGGNDGKNPAMGVTFDPAGNIYSATTLGGVHSAGTVFEITRSGGSWSLTRTYDFTGIQGPSEDANLALDSAGNVYGTTAQDGSQNQGSVFKLTPSGGSWTYGSLHDFTGGSDGGYALSSLIFDAAGNLYGTAVFGGTHGYGVVFEIAP